MAQRTIGIEVGSRKLKAVELESRFGELTLLNYWISDLPEEFRDKLFALKVPSATKEEPGTSQGESQAPNETETTPEQTAELATAETAQAPPEAQPSINGSAAPAPLAAPEKLAEIGATDADIALGIPSEICFYREIELPFSDIKKITQVIRLEAEGHFPFDLEDYLVDFLPPYEESGESRVLTFVVKRDKFSALLTQLKSFNFDPAYAGVEGLTLPLLTMRDAEFPRLFLEIGAKRTILVAAMGTQPFLYRRIMLGLDDLADHIASEMKISVERAEKYLQERDIASWSGDPAQSGAAKAVERWLNSLLAPLRETLHWYERVRKGVDLVQAFSEIILSGGGATIAGIDAYLTAALDILAGKFAIPAWINRPEGFEVGADKEPLLAEALSLALARLSKEGRRNINFRKGEFALKAQYQIEYKRVAFPAALLLMLLVIGVTRCGSQYSLMKSQSRAIKQEMTQKYVAIFPGAKPSDPASQLKAAYMAGTARLAATSSLLYPSPVQCLAAMGDQIPKELSYVINKFSYSEAKVRLEGETTDFAASKNIVDLLSKVEFFKKVTLEDSRSTPNGKINFVISIELKNPGEAKSE